jgi:DNA mismatch endonuclease (patch repair protein)
MDRLSAAERSTLMSKVRSGDTAPELRVRQIAHRLGLRFRLHRRDLPGSPDLIFPKHSVAIFVHGCFWHSHPGCKRASIPKSREEFWRNKLQRNVQRDQAAISALEKKGWRVVVIWECETRNIDKLEEHIGTLFRRRRKKKVGSASRVGF